MCMSVTHVTSRVHVHVNYVTSHTRLAFNVTHTYCNVRGSRTCTFHVSDSRTRDAHTHVCGSGTCRGGQVRNSRICHVFGSTHAHCSHTPRVNAHASYVTRWSRFTSRLSHARVDVKSCRSCHVHVVARHKFQSRTKDKRIVSLLYWSLVTEVSNSTGQVVYFFASQHKHIFWNFLLREKFHKERREKGGEKFANKTEAGSGIFGSKRQASCSVKRCAVSSQV